jgi:hypothetical protein
LKKKPSVDSKLRVAFVEFGAASQCPRASVIRLLTMRPAARRWILQGAKNMNLMRVIILTFSSSICFGCVFNKPIPTLAPPEEINILLKTALHLDIKKDVSIKIEADKFWMVYDLIEPKSYFSEKSDWSTLDLLAEVTIKHPGGRITKVYVRDLGYNPALVSFDDKVYYLAGSHAPAGAMELLRLARSDPPYDKAPGR